VWLKHRRVMAMAKFVPKMLPGIDRPAIASFLTQRGESAMPDSAPTSSAMPTIW
jgi:fatty acid/phospholipid biosynthesis enzyme